MQASRAAPTQLSGNVDN